MLVIMSKKARHDLEVKFVDKFNVTSSFLFIINNSRAKQLNTDAMENQSISIMSTVSVLLSGSSQKVPKPAIGVRFPVASVHIISDMACS